MPCGCPSRFVRRTYEFRYVFRVLPRGYRPSRVCPLREAANYRTLKAGMAFLSQQQQFHKTN